MPLTTGVQLVSAFKEPILKYSNIIKDEFIQIFMNGVGDYIDNFYDKYSKTKTFIYRDEKVNFYDIFYPVTIKDSKHEICEITDIQKLFESRKYIAIIGNAGSGKSMLMRYIFLETVKTFYKIPIVIELRNLNDFAGTINDYIYKILTKNKLAASEKIIEQLLTEGNYLFLLDGYDEIYSNTKNKITTEIEDFIDTFHNNIFVLTSRPGANAESLQRFDNFYVRPLSDKQIKEFINQQFKNHDNKESIGKIISVVEKEDNEEYKEYLSNPLLLSMFIFTFNTYPELPRNKSKFYWNVFDTLCTKHDAFTKKGFWLHERKSKLLNEDFERILQWFSYISIFKGKYNFDLEYLKSLLNSIKEKLNLACSIDDLIYDLTVSISILIQDGTDYTFPHKSLQEYFTALLIRSLERDQKKEIYLVKFKQLYDNTLGGNYNLYKLCYELDKTLFCEFFILPNIKNFISEIDLTDDKTTFISYNKILDIKFYFNDKDDKFSLFGYGYKSIYIDSFISLFELRPLNPFDNKGHFDKALTIINNELALSKNKADKLGKHKIFNFHDNCTDNMVKFANESGMLDYIKNLITIVKEKTVALEKDIKNDGESTKQLLDI